MSSGESWQELAVLAEPTRRRVYDTVRAADAPVSREDVASSAGIGARLAAFHLDRLAEAGLLAVSYARPAGRGGPGAGRPAKRYTPSGTELRVTVPPRRYSVVARVLAAAVAAQPRQADAAAVEEARRVGITTGTGARPKSPPRTRRSALRTVAATLRDLGYEPVAVDTGLRLRNCPFHEVVDVAPPLVCGLNLAMIDGILSGLGTDRFCEARPDGQPPDCCVTLAGRTH